MPSASFYIYASYISVVSKAGKLHRNIKLLYNKEQIEIQQCPNKFKEDYQQPNMDGFERLKTLVS